MIKINKAKQLKKIKEVYGYGFYRNKQGKPMRSIIEQETMTLRQLKEDYDKRGIELKI